MVRAGYKETEIGILPEDWGVKKIGEFTDCTAGGTPSTRIPEYWGGIIPWMSSGELHLRLVKDVEGRITEIGLQNSSTKIIPVNCILIGLAGQGKTRGTVAINKIELCTNQSIAAVFPNDHFVYAYLFYNLQSRYEGLRSISTGDGGRGGLNLRIIRNIDVPFPKKEEQRAIATALSDVDALLSALDKLIAKKRAIKTATMQQLLTGKSRLPGFSGEWREKELRELLVYERPDKYIVQDTEYSDQGNAPVLTANKSFILGYTHEDFGILEDLPVIIFDDFTIDNKYVNFPFKVKSSAIKILKEKHENVNLHFVFERMQLIRFPLGNHKRYYIAEYQNIKLAVPEYDEQNAIASVFEDLDAEISKLETRRAKTQSIKEGMMQELLTGRTRLI